MCVLKPLLQVGLEGRALVPDFLLLEFLRVMKPLEKSSENHCTTNVWSSGCCKRQRDGNPSKVAHRCDTPAGDDAASDVAFASREG